MKYLKIILLLCFLSLILLLSWVEFGGKYILNKSDKRTIACYINTSKKAPDNFANFYNTVYPQSLSTNSWIFTFNTILNIKTQRKECPCNQMAYRIFPLLDIQNKNSFDQFLIARYIEQHFNQKDCLNFNFSTFDFLENRKGIEQVSKSLFNKKVSDLAPIEMGEILALYENPVRNNRYRNPDRAQARAQYFNNLYLENLKSR